MASTPFLYPNVTSVPGSRGVGDSSAVERKKPDGVKSEFDHVFENEISKPQSTDAAEKIDLSQAKQPLKFSAHASQRLQERKIHLDPQTLSKVNSAIDKAEAKGIEDTLVLTGDAALIVNVKNRTVITAMDKASLNGNVFTNIDGAVIV